MSADSSNLPEKFAKAILVVGQAVVPSMIKALDRLVGAAIDVPVAKLQQQKAKIDAQTESYKLIESTIAQTAIAYVDGDSEIAQRAINILVRKEYRKQINREAVASAMVEEMSENAGSTSLLNTDQPLPDLDEDWLNVFERYAENTSSELLQRLWGRVLAGEIRKPGTFSPRTLRFLSEISQPDALVFQALAECIFGEILPRDLAIPPDGSDIRDLIELQSSGLIEGVLGGSLNITFTFGEDGYDKIYEGEYILFIKGAPNSQISLPAIKLTALGGEVIGLLTARNPRDCARNMVNALDRSLIYEASLFSQQRNNKEFEIVEVFWKEE